MNLQNRTDGFLILCAAGLMALASSYADAQTHSGDIGLMLINSRLTTTGGTYSGPLNGRVFTGVMPPSGQTDNPGFDSAAGLLQAGEAIRFDFVREVLYWNGTALVQSPRSMTVSLGSSTATLGSTDDAGKPGFQIAGGDPTGAFHQHLWFSIGSGAPAGVYGVIMTLGAAGTGTFGTSEPFLMAFRRNATNLNPSAGVDAMAAYLTPVPEPTTLGLAGAGVAAWIASRRRRRRKPGTYAKILQMQNVCSNVLTLGGIQFFFGRRVMFGLSSVLAGMSSRGWVGWVALLAMVVLGCDSARADGLHAGDIELEIEDGKLVTHNGRYFEAEFVDIIGGKFKSSTPGFDSAPGLLAEYDPESEEEQEEIGFNVLGPLLFWDGEEMTTPTVGLELWWAGGQHVTVTGTSTGGVAGFSLGGATEEGGAFHEHFVFEIAESAPLGAYGVLLELTPAGTSTFTKSDPFLIVFNRGLGEVAFEAGVDAMVEITAVPEPSSIALAGLGALGLVGAAIRRRMRLRRVAG